MVLSPGVERFLGRTQICVLATTGPGDWPHATPMWYWFRDGELVITTSRRTQKHRNVQRTGKAVVVFDTRKPPYYALTIKGRAEIGPGLTREEEYAIAVRYLGESRVQAFMDYYDTGEGDDATIVVTPEKVIEFTGG